MSELSKFDTFNLSNEFQESTKINNDNDPLSSSSQLPPKQNKDYCKFRLSIKLIQDIYVFPEDENSKREFYDTISTDLIKVNGKNKSPGQRNLKLNSSSSSLNKLNIGTNLLELGNQSCLFNDEYNGNLLFYVSKYFEIFKTYIGLLNISNLETIKMLKLIFLVFFNYLEDSEFASQINNLRTHQQQIKTNFEKKWIRDNLKIYIIEIFNIFFKNYSLAFEFFKKGQIKCCKNNWKFIENLINLVMINYSRIKDYKFNEIGLNLDPKLAIINHSCVPNVFQIEYEFKKFRVLNTLPLKPGDELFVSYLPNCGIPQEIRNYQLNLNYYFKCSCTLCKSKNDLFFTMQCNECFKNIKSPRLTLVLSSANNLLIESSCSKCFHPFDIEIYTRQILIRNFFMALMLRNSKSNYNFNDDGYFTMLQKEFSTMVENNSVSYLIKQLSESIDKFEIPTERIPFVKGLIDEVMAGKVFALYTFPFNIIVEKISKQCCEFKNFDSGMEYLKYYSRLLFAVKLPSDISNQLFFNQCLYLDMAENIEKLMQRLYDEKIDTFFGTFKESMELLARCQFFFLKHVKSPFESVKVENKLIKLCELYQPIKSTKSIHSCLEQLFIYANANIFITKTRFLIFNAKQEQVTLFHTFDTDDQL
ncbi:uncharacterized protein KGF55_003623 [Candida pseudojiufengensis]|uniref:uncharacterized protein n=1 Tax=Candida pseudojiufengensis TaxID=497109 RepID=UPI0022240A3A|nr:uncharacterized protein KGF55_003623 [Candida pseudojiufengensis]KAI5962547.1 hypothetical protein KGF55_003623 [Candida pseudojiufengensis]